MDSVVIADCCALLLYIWQSVFLFAWIFLHNIEESCHVLANRSIYDNGVAATAIVSFLALLIPVVAEESVEVVTFDVQNEDHQKDEREDGTSPAVEGGDTTDTVVNPVLLRQSPPVQRTKKRRVESSMVSKHKISDIKFKFEAVFVGVHICWLLYGTFTFYPAFFVYELYSNGGRLVGINSSCVSPIHFWFYIIHLTLEWVLILIFIIWYATEESMPDKLDYI